MELENESISHYWFGTKKKKQFRQTNILYYKTTKGCDVSRPLMSITVHAATLHTEKNTNASYPFLQFK